HHLGHHRLVRSRRARRAEFRSLGRGAGTHTRIPPARRRGALRRPALPRAARRSGGRGRARLRPPRAALHPRRARAHAGLGARAPSRPARRAPLPVVRLGSRRRRRARALRVLHEALRRARRSRPMTSTASGAARIAALAAGLAIGGNAVAQQPQNPVEPQWWPGKVRSAAAGAPGTSGDLASGAAWKRLLEELARAGELVQDVGTPATDIDRAEGYRHIGSLL